MPIYAYRCEVCGFAKDVLQKMSDAQLTECPSCRESSFKKQVTAAAFQLKGSGWYVTDFRGGAKDANVSNASGGETSAAAAAPSESSTAVAAATVATASTAATPAAAPSGTSAGSKAGASAGK